MEKLYNQVSEKNEQLDNALAEVRRARIRCGRDAVGPEVLWFNVVKIDCAIFYSLIHNRNKALLCPW